MSLVNNWLKAKQELNEAKEHENRLRDLVILTEFAGDAAKSKTLEGGTLAYSTPKTLEAVTDYYGAYASLVKLAKVLNCSVDQLFNEQPSGEKLFTLSIKVHAKGFKQLPAMALPIVAEFVETKEGSKQLTFTPTK